MHIFETRIDTNRRALISSKRKNSSTGLHFLLLPLTSSHGRGKASLRKLVRLYLFKRDTMFRLITRRFSMLSGWLATKEGVSSGLLLHYKYTVFTLSSLWNSLTRSHMHNTDGLCLEGVWPELLVPELSECPSNLPSEDLLGWGGLLWAVPKKRTSHSKKRMRMAHKYLKPKSNFMVCVTCNNLKLLHVLCGHCLKQTLLDTAKMRKEQEMAKVESSEVTE